MKPSRVLAEVEGDVEVRSENQFHHGYGTICGVDRCSSGIDGAEALQFDIVCCV